ncbi:MAG TPA: RluA family pseudouridine synthase [Syntrophomonadaceae bacterium]|nr:RluA family pseudouridine synthase [Syntrophomonadaceae bacterium]
MHLAELYRFKVDRDAAGKRLDQFLTHCIPSLSRSQVQRLIEKGNVLVNSKKERSSFRVRLNDEVEMIVPPPEQITLSPEPIPLDILYEDDDLLVINKPAGLVVHPAAGHRSGTLVNALLNHCPDLSGIGGYLRPGIVHRLDKDTSGLMLVSKSDLTHRELAAQLKARKIKRKYLALVHGEVREEKGLIDAPLGRDPLNRKRITVLSKDDPYGREARTHYRVKERFPGYTLLDVELETGRTHQIRVHLAYAGYPVAGDPVYGPRRNPLQLPGQALHAYRITFTHPRTGELLNFEAPPPPAFSQALDYLRSLRSK